MDIFKEEVAKFMKSLPKDATWEDVIYEAYVREKISNAQKDVREGKYQTQAEVEKESENW